MDDTKKALAKLESDAAKMELADEFIKGWDHFTKCVDFGRSWLDAEAIAWMNNVSIMQRKIKEKPCEEN